jgi:hypothetical protein
MSRRAPQVENDGFSQFFSQISNEFFTVSCGLQRHFAQVSNQRLPAIRLMLPLLARLYNPDPTERLDQSPRTQKLPSKAQGLGTASGRHAADVLGDGLSLSLEL